MQFSTLWGGGRGVQEKYIHVKSFEKTRRQAVDKNAGGILYMLDYGYELALQVWVCVRS